MFPLLNTDVRLPLPYQHPARVAQLVEHQLPKLRVASSNLVSRSLIISHLDANLGGCFVSSLNAGLNK
jgi:hypothetical protein